MAHTRNDSLSSLSSLTSISSRSSVETYESLKEKINDIENSKIDLQSLVHEAEKIIDEKLTPTSQKAYKHQKDSKSEEDAIDLDEVMKAMLVCAEERDGQRYVASAIVACSKCPEVVETLVALGTTWLTHFLFVFRATGSHDKQPNKEPSELATPTLDETASHLGEGVGHRRSSFAGDVKKRDGYKCVVTGYKDVTHPQRNESDPDFFLQASHILRRSIANYDNDHTSASFKSAVTTFDILRNFTRIPVEKLEDLHSHIDDPSNGIILEFNAHQSFDRFGWCLQKTETENVYSLKIYKARLLREPPDGLVRFRDCSNDFGSDSSKPSASSEPSAPPEASGSNRKRRRVDSEEPTVATVSGIALPNPKYISIHATLAGVLNMSGAGRFFDELLDKYKDDDGKVSGIRSWPELEEAIGGVNLKESIVQSFQSSIKVIS